MTGIHTYTNHQMVAKQLQDVSLVRQKKETIQTADEVVARGYLIVNLLYRHLTDEHIEDKI